MSNQTHDDDFAFVFLEFKKWLGDERVKPILVCDDATLAVQEKIRTFDVRAHIFVVSNSPNQSAAG